MKPKKVQRKVRHVKLAENIQTKHQKKYTKQTRRLKGRGEKNVYSGNHEATQNTKLSLSRQVEKRWKKTQTKRKDQKKLNIRIQQNIFKPGGVNVNP